MNWIDIILLAILVFFIAFGFYKGFIFSILSLFSTFVNFIIAIFLTRPVNNLFNSWFKLEGALTSSFASRFSNMGAGFSTNLVGMSSAEIKSHISTTLTEGKVPFKNLLKSMLRIDPEAISSKSSLTLNDILSKSLGSFFSLIISFVVVFILIWLVLFVIYLVSKKAKQVEGIRITDRILGVVFGIVKAGITVCFIFAFLSFFNENGVLAPLFDYIKQSSMGNFIYSNVNLLVDKYLNFKTIISAVKSFA